MFRLQKATNTTAPCDKKLFSQIVITGFFAISFGVYTVYYAYMMYIMYITLYDILSIIQNTNVMHLILFIRQIFSSTCFEYQVLIFRRNSCM